jgi:hypothetical protein
MYTYIARDEMPPEQREAAKVDAEVPEEFQED